MGEIKTCLWFGYNSKPIEEIYTTKIDILYFYNAITLEPRYTLSVVEMRVSNHVEEIVIA